MYLWNTDGLAQELKEGTLSESDKFKYLFGLLILISITLSISDFVMPDELSLSNIIQTIIDTIIFIVGTYLSYRINRDGDGINFIERYICLIIPLMIKVFVFYLFAYIILGALFGTNFLIIDDLFKYWFFYTYSTILSIYLYWRLYVHIKWISHENTGIN